MEGEFKNLLQVWFLAITCLTYCYYIPSKIPSGIPRLLSLLPILYLLIILPLNLSTIHLCGLTSFLLVWLTNFKLLLFSFNHGPLSPPPSKLSHFISIASLPIKIKTKNNSNTYPSHQKSFQIFSRPTLSVIIKLLLFCMLLYAYKCNYKHYLYESVTCLLHIYLLVEFALATCASLVRIILGIDLSPQFNEPYFSTSLQDFWGRRWNLVVSSILRSTVYGPIRRVCTRMIDDKWVQLTGVFVTFIISGLMHEVIYYYLTRAPPTWEMTLYFIIHGTCLSIEVVVKRVLTDRWRLHPVASWLLMALFVMVTSLWLLCPLLLRDGVHEKMRRELLHFCKFDEQSNL